MTFKALFCPKLSDPFTHIGLLVLRVCAGGLMAGAHGVPKLANWAEKSATFADPLGVGSAASLALAIFGELVCGVAVVLGLFTRVTAVPVIITMLVAALVVHSDDPWNKKEFALLYAVPFLTLVFTGAGRYSLDSLIHARLPGASARTQ